MIQRLICIENEMNIKFYGGVFIASWTTWDGTWIEEVQENFSIQVAFAFYKCQ